MYVKLLMDQVKHMDQPRRQSQKPYKQSDVYMQPLKQSRGPCNV